MVGPHFEGSTEFVFFWLLSFFFFLLFFCRSVGAGGRKKIRPIRTRLQANSNNNNNNNNNNNKEEPQARLLPETDVFHCFFLVFFTYSRSEIAVTEFFLALAENEYFLIISFQISNSRKESLTRFYSVSIGFNGVLKYSWWVLLSSLSLKPV